MKTIQRFLLTLTLAAATALPLFAYEAETTHRKMTAAATKASVLYTDPRIMSSLGLLKADRQTFSYYKSEEGVILGMKDYSLADFVAEGAYEEDYPALRALNHFYDPLHDRGLRAFGVAGIASWRYMTEPTDIPGQAYSLRDARWYLNHGLTFQHSDKAYADSQRKLGMTYVLRTLGHVMHHLQDMAQPQHVRNDQHLSYVSAWESRYEKYTAARGADLQSMMDEATPNYPSPDFLTATDFWTNSSGTGIAQQNNREFLSHGTNFRLSATGVTTGAYPLPVPDGSADYTPAELGLTLRSNDQAQCGNPAINCTMTMYSTLLVPRASTLSIFDQDLRATGVEVVWDADILGFKPVARRFFDLNQVNFDDVHGWLIRRAVSFSAGMVNHFFRGKLEISEPTTGTYSVVDHSTGEGFRKIRVTAKNITPDEALFGGTIRLIATYHLNNCYQPDLSGEWQLDGAGQVKEPCPNYRSPEEHISLSLEQAVSFGVDESKQMTFTLVDPIPVNATDLKFQLYYTGIVGAENESFALGTLDVSEPTFMAAMNATDVFELGGTYYKWQDIVAGIAAPPFNAIDIDKSGTYNPPKDVNVTGADFNFQMYVNGMKVADAPAVPQGRFTRLAMIVDLRGFDFRMIAVSTQFSRSDSDYGFPAKISQYYFEDDTPRHTAVAPLRNHTLQHSSTTLWGYYPASTANIKVMPKSEVANAATPVPLQMAPGVLLGLSSPTTESLTSSIKSTEDAGTPPVLDAPAQRMLVPATNAKPVMPETSNTVQALPVRSN